LSNGFKYLELYFAVRKVIEFSPGFKCALARTETRAWADCELRIA